MRRTLPVRFWVEVGVAALTTALTVLTILVPTWIETIFGIDPDGGNGTLEWAIVAMSCILSAAIWFAAQRDWRRASSTG